MGDNKSVAELLKVLGHPVRLQILRFLLKGPSCATLFNCSIDVSQPNLSQHLKALTDAGIVDFCKIGTKRCFYVTRPDFAKELLGLFDKSWERVTLSEEYLRSNYGTE